MRSIIFLEPHNKSQIVPQKDVTEIANESLYETHLRMLLKIGLRVHMDAKSSQLKDESKSKFFSAPSDAQKNVNETTINAFEMRLMVL